MFEKILNMGRKKKKDKEVVLPIGNQPPLGPVPSNVIEFPGNWKPVTQEYDTQVIWVDFKAKRKIA